MIQSAHHGLTDAEVQASKSRHGRNALELKSHDGVWRTVKGIVLEPLFILLVCTAIIYFLLGNISEGVTMLAALSITSGIGIYQEGKSRTAIETLKQITAPHAKVIRNGATTTILIEDIVVDDLVIIEKGMVVPADAVVIEVHDLTVNESNITGESVPVAKDLSANNKIYEGTNILSGYCIARVNAIGINTAFGKISKSLQEVEAPPSPLLLQIRRFVRGMAFAGLFAFIIVWGINFYLSHSVLNGFLHGLTMAMSIVPEEIPLAFSTFMAVGAYRLYKLKVIAKNTNTVETLGTTTVICSDKTGTLTENKMEVVVIYELDGNRLHDYTEDQYDLNPVLEYAMWASETDPFDMMERAVHEVYGSVAKVDARPEYKMIQEYPLEGTPPIMTHVFGNKEGVRIIACKGGIEGVLAQCSLPEGEKQQVLNVAAQYTAKGYRILAVAKGVDSVDSLPSSQFDLAMSFIGFIGFYDPPKANTRSVLQRFYAAGINVKMITGDHPETAANIAGQIGLVNNAGVLTGQQVLAMDRASLRNSVTDVNIYARMFPEAKLKVVEALKENGAIVAMTGDGVNDGPALKAAHIGIAMGARGSEVAKEAAALILADDDLSRMVDAVAMGRRIYENLKKAIQYIISIHIPIILVIIVPLLLFWRIHDFFYPIHIIFMELIMGPTCSIIFENEPIEANSMSRPPRKIRSTFFSWRELSLSILQGAIVTIGCLGLAYYFIQSGSNESEIRTIIYVTLLFSNIFLTLVNRSFYYSVFTTLRYKNNLVPLILAISLVILLVSVYYGPAQRLFAFTALPPVVVMYCLLTAFVAVMWVEVLKYFRRKAIGHLKSQPASS